jgi:hypothetical protein
LLTISVAREAGVASGQKAMPEDTIKSDRIKTAA